MSATNNFDAWLDGAPFVSPLGDPDFNAWLEGAPDVEIDDGTQQLVASAAITVATSGTLTQASPGLVGTAAITVDSSSTVSGAGAMSGTAVISVGATPTLSGTGSIAASAAVSIDSSTTLSAAGGFVASAAIQTGGQAMLTGTGNLSGSPAITVSASAETIAPEAGSTIAFLASGTLTGTAELSGSDSITFSGPATITIKGRHLSLLTFDLYVAHGKAIIGKDDTSTATMPLFVQGDTISLRIFLLKPSAGGGLEYIPPVEGRGLEVALGPKPAGTHYAEQNVWVPSLDAGQPFWENVLDLDTPEINTLLAGKLNAQAWFEIKISENGEIQTVLSQKVQIESAVILPSVRQVSPSPYPLSKEVGDATFLNRTIPGSFTLVNETDSTKRVEVYCGDDGEFHAEAVTT